jgi:hypothetical protein
MDNNKNKPINNNNDDNNNNNQYDDESSPILITEKTKPSSSSSDNPQQQQPQIKSPKMYITIIVLTMLVFIFFYRAIGEDNNSTTNNDLLYPLSNHDIFFSTTHQCAAHGTWQLTTPSPSNNNENQCLHHPTLNNNQYEWVPTDPTCPVLPPLTLRSFCSILPTDGGEFLILGDSISAGFFFHLRKLFAPTSPVQYYNHTDPTIIKYLSNMKDPAVALRRSSGAYFDLHSCSSTNNNNLKSYRIRYVQSARLGGNNNENYFGFGLPSDSYAFTSIINQASVVLFNVGAHIPFDTRTSVESITQNTLQLLLERTKPHTKFIYRTSTIGHDGCELSPLNQWTSDALRNPSSYTRNPLLPPSEQYRCVQYLQANNISHLQPLPNPQAVQEYLAHCDWFGASRYRFHDAIIVSTLINAKHNPEFNHELIKQHPIYVLDIYNVDAARIDGHWGVFSRPAITHDCLHRAEECRYITMNIWIRMLIDLLS